MIKEKYKIFLFFFKGIFCFLRKELMRYFNDASTASASTNPLINKLDDAVKEARTNSKWRHDYMTWQMYGEEKLEEGLEKGLKALVNSLYSLNPDFSSLYKIICNNPDYADVTEEQVRKYYDLLTTGDK